MIHRIGRTERRVVTALLVTAIVPLLTAMWLANGIISHIASTAFVPEFEEHLDRSLGLYKDLVASMKRAMKNEAAAIAEQEELREAADQKDVAALKRALAQALADHPTLLTIRVEDADGGVLADQKRTAPVDEARERPFTVLESLGEGAGAAPTLVAVFAADRTRLMEMEGAQKFAQSYKSLAHRERAGWIERPHLRMFAVLLGFTVVLAVLTGVLVVRPLIRRIDRLAAATRPVAEGDLSIRVVDAGKDEIGALARAFNQMLEQLDQSRARIEFLKRVGEWQQMARRLAHEIKNPLTPIQLAVEECHRRYPGEDPAYKKLLGTTLDIVAEEVASLRRLVGEFAAFARLPQADLKQEDLRLFLVEQEKRLSSELLESEPEVELGFEIEAEDMPVALDRTMLYRVLSNLVANAAQAGRGRPGARVRVRATKELDSCVLDVEDNGPGIRASMRQSVFDPYMTTKKDGTGLGLTIAKKVIIDHGGHIDVDESPLGGARFRVRLPLWGTSASEAALAQAERHPVSG